MTAPTIVFVLLGENPAPTLYHFAHLAKNRRPNSDMLLITDFPKKHERFPGEMLEYRRANAFEPMQMVARKFPERRQLAGGYWLFTIERLFALGLLEENGIRTPVMHLESDVMLTATDEHEELLARHCERTSVPRYSNEMGIASFLYSPSVTQLQHDLKLLGEILQDQIATQRQFCTDMQLLGIALNAGQLQELPSYPKDAWLINSPGVERRLVFDGLAYGQYLFGQDPVHSAGMRMSGHQNEFFQQNLSELRWSLGRSKSSDTTIGYEWGSHRLELANIHVHSKEEIESPSLVSERWSVAIKEARGLHKRQITGPFADHIHSQRVSFANRLRLSSQSGKIRTALEFLRHAITGKSSTTS